MGKRLSSGKRNTTASAKDTKLLWIVIVLLALLVAGGTFAILNNITKQDTYYVLNTNLPSRTQITPQDLSPVSTSQNSAPQNAIGLSEVQQGTVYTKYPLQAGDVISASNAGSLDTINEGIPDNWVVTSFEPADNDPIVENLQRGDYFDIMATNMKKEDQRPAGDNSSNLGQIKVGQYVFRNVMVLDNPATTTANDNNDSANGATSQTQNSTTAFVVGMSPQNAAMLTILTKNFDTKIVMSPRYNTYANPSELDDLYKTFDFNAVIGDNPSGIIASECLAQEEDGKYKINSKTGTVDTTKENCTDPTFAPKERDAFGVPYEFNAQYDRRDENGDIIPLTQNEIKWCQNMFGENADYYMGDSWADEKQYCVDHTSKDAKDDVNFKKMYDDQKKEIADKQRNSTSGSLSSSSNNDSSDNGDSMTTDDTTESPSPEATPVE